MTHINPSRANAVRTTPATLDSVCWGKNHSSITDFDQTTSTLIFAALLIVCSLTVGCSTDQPKTVSSNQTPITQLTPPAATNVEMSTPTPALQAAAKPVHRRVVHKAPANVAYADKNFGVSFQYPRRYELKTGDAASELVSTGSVPMDFVQPGGVTLAAVALPESTYPKSDLASAYFNVSVNQNLTAERCREFSIPQPLSPTSSEPATQPEVQATAQLATPPISKLLIGDLELQSTETLAEGNETGKRTREEASKYYHVFQNGACYEFALRVATTGTKNEAATAPELKTEIATQHVDRGEVFQRLEKILATVKINPVAAPEVTAEIKANAQPTPTVQETPAQ
jgi:hypothetical protein